LIIKKVSVTKDELLDPKSRIWDVVKFLQVRLYPTPVGVISSDYVRKNYPPGGDGGYGAVKEVELRGLHNGKEIVLAFRWKDDQKNTDITDVAYPDGIAVIFPLKGSAPVSTMGSEKYPVNGWFWRGDLSDKPMNIVAMGTGTVETKKYPLFSRSIWDKSYWNVTIGRTFAVSKGHEADNIILRSGSTAKIAVACWEGGNKERAGCKSYSMSWIDLVIE